MESIDAIIPRLARALGEEGRAVLTAPPGSGKTTVVPLSLLEQPWLGSGKIVILEPRRLAARLAARRLAANLGEEVGRTVGLVVRFEKKTSAATRIVVATEGVLTRMLQEDPELPDCGLVIFDEFHERSLEADLALAFCLDVRENLRPDLRLLLMSATLDCERISTLLGSCPVITAGGRPYPVETIHLSAPGRREPDFHRFDFLHCVNRTAAAINRALSEQEGDILVFLPGTGEIRKVAETVAPALPANVALRPLYGDLPRAEQDRAILPDPEKRRVILATAVAETSVTIEGITTVIDSGFSRRPRFDPGRGMTRLETVRVTRAGATQRAGRAGRLGPGVCYRLWPGEFHASLQKEPVPEIRASDLAPLALEIIRWGARSPEDLEWLDPPPPSAFSKAMELLRRLGFIDERGLSAKGRKAARIPAHPRLAAMIIAGEEHRCPNLACDIAAILSERDILAGKRDAPVDLELRLDLIAAMRRNDSAPVRAHGGDAHTVRRIIRTADLLRRITPGRDTAGSEMAQVVLAAGYPDRIAGLRPGSRGNYLLSGGSGAFLPDHDHMAATDFLLAPDLGRGQNRLPRINLALNADPDRLQKYLPQLFRVEEKIFWDQESGRVRALSRTLCGAVVCSETPLCDPDPERCFQILCQGIRAQPAIPLVFSPAARGLQERIIAARRLDLQGNWPEVTDADLMDSLEQWLPSWAYTARSLDEVKKIDMLAVLSAMLGHRQRMMLEKELPETITTPAGSRIRLKYPPDGPPVMAVRIQEMFGCRKTPAVMGGRVQVILHLLNPAMRPVQVTGDLESFWRNVYPEVKKELSGRYPKHPWPDDPLNARPWRPGRGKD